MSDEADLKSSPAFIPDYVPTQDLVNELMRRHQSLVLAVLPFPGKESVPLGGRVYVNGTYLCCMGLALKLYQYVDNMCPAIPRETSEGI